MQGYRTVLFAVLLAILGGVQQADLARIVPPEYMGLAMLLIAGIVAALRVATTGPLGGGSDDAEE